RGRHNHPECCAKLDLTYQPASGIAPDNPFRLQSLLRRRIMPPPEIRMSKLSLIISLLLAVMPTTVIAQTKGWQQLFNGKDLTGWKHVGPGEMTVEDGLIKSHGGMGLLYWTGGKFANCMIRVVFRMQDEND